MADTTLVGGAYKAAMGEVRLGAAKGLTEISKTVGEAAAKGIKSRAKEFDKAAKAASERMGGAQTKEQTAAWYDEFGGKTRTKFILGNNKTRTLILKDMSAKAVDAATDNVDVKESADLSSGMNDTFKATSTGIDIAGYLDGTNKKVWNDDTGQYGYMITDPETQEKRWMSRTEIKEIQEYQSIDTNTRSAMGEIALKISELGKANSKLDNPENFDYNTWENNIRTNVVEEGNLRSMKYDKGVLVNGRVFYDDLQAAIMNETYGTLGIADWLIAGIDPNTDNKEFEISKEDAEVIASRLLEDDDLSKIYCTAYATRHLEKQWGGDTNVESSGGSYVKPGGGIVDEDHVFTDHDADYDYKMVNGKWHTRKKDSSGQWIDISNNAEAVNKLNTKYSANPSDTGGGVQGGTVNESGEWIPDADTEQEELNKIMNDPNLSDKEKVDYLEKLWTTQR